MAELHLDDHSSTGTSPLDGECAQESLKLPIPPSEVGRTQTDPVGQERHENHDTLDHAALNTDDLTQAAQAARTYVRMWDTLEHLGVPIEGTSQHPVIPKDDISPYATIITSLSANQEPVPHYTSEVHTHLEGVGRALLLHLGINPESINIVTFGEKSELQSPLNREERCKYVRLEVDAPPLSLEVASVHFRGDVRATLLAPETERCFRISDGELKKLLDVPDLHDCSIYRWCLDEQARIGALSDACLVTELRQRARDLKVHEIGLRTGNLLQLTSTVLAPLHENTMQRLSFHLMQTAFRERLPAIVENAANLHPSLFRAFLQEEYKKIPPSERKAPPTEKVRESKVGGISFIALFKGALAIFSRPPSEAPRDFFALVNQQSHPPLERAISMGIRLVEKISTRSC